MSAALATTGHVLTAAPRSVARLVRRRPWLALVAVLIMLAASGAFTPLPAAADPANGDGYEPVGFGDLLKGPDTPATGRTLYEAYPIGLYYFDTSRLGVQDSLMVILNGVASVVMFLSAAIIRGAIVLVWQIFDHSAFDGLLTAITPMIGASATALNGWLLPSTLALGAVVAYAQHRQGSGLSQIAWVFGGGLLAVSFATSPGLWVDTISSVRSVTATSVVSASADNLSVAQVPFSYTGATYDTSDPTGTMMRKSADAIWRTYVVAPWCIAEFGSSEACSVYGKALLDVGSNPDDRSKWIETNAEGHPGYYNSDAAGYRWVAGKNAADRLGIAVVSFIVSVIFGVLLIAIGFAANLAWIAAIMLLAVGVFFAILSCIPGRPRAWAGRWMESVVGATIQSVLGALVVTATLVMTTGAFSVSSTQGWAVGAGMSLTIAFAAFTMRRTIATIVTAMTPGMGMSTLIGAMALRAGARALGRAGGAALGGAGRAARSASRAAGRGAVKGANAVRDIGPRLGWANSVPRYRTAPAHQPPKNQGPNDTPQLGPGPSGGPRPGLPGGAGSRPLLEAPNRSGTATVDGRSLTTPRFAPARGRTHRTGPAPAPAPAARPSGPIGPGRYARVIEVGPDGRAIPVHPRGVGDPHLRDNPPVRHRPARPLVQTVPAATPDTGGEPGRARATRPTTAPSRHRPPANAGSRPAARVTKGRPTSGRPGGQGHDAPAADERRRSR